MTAKTTLVRVLLGSWDGLTSRDVAMGRAAVRTLVDWMFCWIIRRCPLLVASDLERCLVMSDGVRPGQDWKCPRCTARRNVEGTGLKAQAWRKLARSCLVWACRMAPLAE